MPTRRSRVQGHTPQQKREQQHQRRLMQHNPRPRRQQFARRADLGSMLHEPLEAQAPKNPEVQEAAQHPTSANALALPTAVYCPARTASSDSGCAGMSYKSSSPPTASNRSNSRTTLRPRQRPFPQPSIAPPDCEAIQTNILWRKVLQSRRMSEEQEPRPMRQTRSSTRKRKIESTTISSSRPPTSKTFSTVLDSETSISRAQASKNKSPRVTDKNFREDVFPRYGITVTDEPDYRSPYEYFGTDDPKENGYGNRVQDWYQIKQGHKDCNVWLSFGEEDASRIAKQYRNMMTIKANEAKLSHRGKIYFFREDEIFGPDDEDRGSSTYFELEWAPNPDGKRLCCPPEVENCGSAFTFTTNPDCTYWLTTRRMNIDYRKSIGSYTFVLADVGAAAPYLTIEFKKDGQSFEAAENQVAVSATLILYNRYRLRCDRLKAQKAGKERLTLEDFSDIQHFGIAVNGSEPSLYVLRPRLVVDNSVSHDDIDLKFRWRGCDMVKFNNMLELRQVLGVLNFAEWINELNNWGLSKHSQQFVIDIKGLVLKAPGGARVSLSDEEKAKLGIVTKE